MEEANHKRVSSQAFRLKAKCGEDGKTCDQIVTRLLTIKPPLSARQRERMISAAVVLGRYGLGCQGCKTSIAKMPHEVREAYRAKYGKIPPSCGVCSDTLIGSDGLRCLACDGLTRWELKIADEIRSGTLRAYFNRYASALPPEQLTRARDRFDMAIERLISAGAISTSDLVWRPCEVKS